MYVNVHVPNNDIQCMCINACTCTCTFEGNHCLVSAVLRVRVVVTLKLLFHCSDDGHHLLQPMESRLIPQR